MEAKEYTPFDLAKAMLNEACPKMVAYYGDLATDLMMLERMQEGHTAQWFYRKNGTTFIIEDSKRFEEEYKYWKDEIFKAYTILKTEFGMFSVTEFNTKKH